MLGNHRELLIKEILEAEVVHADDERLCPQIWPPVPYRFEADQFPLVSCELGMVRGNGTTEECHWPVALVQDRAKA
jgi:hypothetical protein